MVTITGGKLTTWRRMAKETVDRIVERDGSEVKCRTHEVPLGMPVAPADLRAPRPEAAREQLAGRYGHVAHDVLALAAGARAGRADRRRPARPARRGRLRRAPRAGPHGRRRAAAPHAARADRGAAAAGARSGRDRARRGGDGRGAGLGRARRAREAEAFREEARAEGILPAPYRPFAGLHPASPACSTGGPAAPRNPPLEPLCHAVSSPCSPPSSSWSRPPPRTPAGSRPSRSTARTPTSSRSATSTSRATAPARSPTCATTAASRTRSSRASSAAPGAAGARRPDARRGHRGQGRRRRRQPPRGRLDRGRHASTRRVAPGGDTPGAFAADGPARRAGRAGRSTSTSASTAPPTPSGRRAATSRAARLQDATWTRVAPPLDIDSAREAGTGAAAPARRGLRRGLRGRDLGRARPDGSTHVWARRITGMNLSAVPAGPDDARAAPRTRRTSTSRTTARSPGSSSARTSTASPRTIARRLVGSQFEARGGRSTAASPASAPKVDMSGAGRGYAVAQDDRRRAGRRRVARPRPLPAPAGGSTRIDSVDADQARGREHRPQRHRDRLAASGCPDGNSVARARYQAGDGRRRSAARSRSRAPDLGPVADPGVFIGGDRLGDFAVGDGPGQPGRADARPSRSSTARRARRSSRPRRPTSARRGPSCAGGRASICGARRRSASTWTAS